VFYLLLRRSGNGQIAWIGALIFGIFPADTTHTFAEHALGVHTSLTFLLLASHLYLSDRLALSYLMSLGCLLTYESPYLVFLVVPLLVCAWDRRLLQQLIRHASIWLGILVVIVVVRVAMAESRIEAIGSSLVTLIQTSKHILAASVIGPAVSLSMFWQGPWWTVSHWNPELTSVSLICFPIFAFVLFGLDTGAVGQESPVSVILPFRRPHQTAGIRLTIWRPSTVKLLLVGLLALSLAYSFSFTHYPPTATYGRATSVHLAAAFGAAILLATLAWLLLVSAKWPWLRMAAIAVLAGYLSWVVAYRVAIQQDFVLAWQNQRLFWSGVVRQAPDLQDGTLILVAGTAVPQTHFIETLSWSAPFVLRQIFEFPATWSSPPRLFVVPPHWARSVVRQNDQLFWGPPLTTGGGGWEVLPDPKSDSARGQRWRALPPIRVS
jgi:hypothetical protein